MNIKILIDLVLQDYSPVELRGKNIRLQFSVFVSVLVYVTKQWSLVVIVVLFVPSLCSYFLFIMQTTSIENPARCFHKSLFNYHRL